MPHPPEPRPSTVRVWDLPVRLFHWTLVAAVAVALISAEEEGPLSTWHSVAGWVSAVLIAFRLVWGVVGGQHARFANFLRPSEIGPHLREMASGKPKASLGHNPLGGIAILALLGLTAATVMTGAAMGGEAGEDLHGALGYGLLALAGVHVASVVIMSLLSRENLIGAFITGSKRADRHPGATDAAPPLPIAIPLAAVVVGAAAYGATRIDPNAFIPTAHAEASEGGGEDEGGESED